MLTPISYNTKYPSFGVNPNSPKLRFKQEDFFIRIRGYGKNHNWAKEIINTANTAAGLIRRDTSPENVLKVIATGVAKANYEDLDLNKRFATGILRTLRDNWRGEENCEILTAYESGKYAKYKDRLDALLEAPLESPNDKIGLSRPTIYQDIFHGKSELINSSLEYVFKLCRTIFPKYVNQDIKPEELNEVNKNIAEIRWVLAHSTPWKRGSDAISNVFIRAIYKAIGIKTYPVAKGKSLDMEAFCTELKEYKRRFPEYFEKPPEIIE